jgi:EAL domain-containing protein (putative c-di-GMP-specific phosphodiesterase class I)
MDKTLQRRRMVEHDLRLALGREEFGVVYQSQYDLPPALRSTLRRWVRRQHPLHGKVEPANFISVAEETGLIVPLGGWVTAPRLQRCRHRDGAFDCGGQSFADAISRC